MKVCCVEGCNGKHHSKGYCQKHYRLFKKYGCIPTRTIRDGNEFIFYEDYIEIVLYDINCIEVARAIIDKDDYDKVKDYKWCIKEGYVMTRRKSDRKSIFLHRLIIENSNSEVIDHINGNPLDNRKCNLREATSQQNNFNMTNEGQGNNNRRGTTFNKNSGKWMAYIGVNNKRIHLGYFDTEEEAIKAREEAEIKYFGEYRRK